jgi:hypothetical protein
MKTRILIIIASLIAVSLIGVGMSVAVGLENVFYDSSLLNDSQDIDPVLLQTRVLDWVNTNRLKNDVGGLNLDDTLNDLAKLRSTDMSQIPLDQAALISNLDVNQIARNNNLECIIDDRVMPIHEIALLISHSKFDNLEDMVNYLMGLLIEHEVEKEKLFDSDSTRTGISVSMNNDFLVIVQNFC